MTEKSLSMLADPQPCGHMVLPYSADDQLIEAVALFTAAGLDKDQAVILVTTEAHRSALRDRLKIQGFSARALESTGQLVWMDAETLLSSFAFDGIIDELVFTTKIGALINKAAVSGGKSRRVRVFGEMVNLLWVDSMHATEKLEQLWNRVVEAHRVPLLCGYALARIGGEQFPESLTACHSHSLA